MEGPTLAGTPVRVIAWLATVLIWFALSVIGGMVQGRVPVEDATPAVGLFLLSVFALVRTRRVACLLLVTTSIGYGLSLGQLELSVEPAGDGAVFRYPVPMCRCDRSEPLSRRHTPLAIVGGVIDHATGLDLKVVRVNDGKWDVLGEHRSHLSPMYFTQTTLIRKRVMYGLCIGESKGRPDVAAAYESLGRGGGSTPREGIIGDLRVREAYRGGNRSRG
jgi:hypothetical protein